MQPRWYQADLIEKTRLSWSQGNRNVIVVSPPRSGKTPTSMWLAQPFLDANQGVIINVHREELVRQISMTAAEFGIQHNMIAPSDVVSDIVRRQVKKYGRSFYNQNALLWIGSVQTINARAEKLRRFAPRVGLWVTDEAHHCLIDNQWGKVINLFPNAYGLGFTATPARTDRKSLYRQQGGVFDDMVKGVTARQLINEGFICDYRVIAPPASIDRSNIRVGSTGDFTQRGLVEAKRDSTITGDCVHSYLKYAPNTQAVCFAVDINHSTEIAEAFRDAGISAETVSSKTPKNIRKMMMDKFERGVFQVLVNVDLFGEGLDVSGIETVIMARPTQSYVLYVQQFFRALTKGDNKSLGTIIDHAGNVGYFGKTHGLPDAYNGWSLEAEERGRRRKKDDDVIMVTTCTECFNVYEAVKGICPFCGVKPVPADRSKVEHVEGDLVELDPNTLALLRGEAERIGGEPQVPQNVDGIVARSIEKRWLERREAQASLRSNISLWAGYWRDRNASDSEIYRRFYAKYDIDIMTAQTLKTTDAINLTERIDKDLLKMVTTGN
jgi:superfamily II DNA or RNA helicase